MSQRRLEPSFLDTSVGSIFLLLRAPLNAERCALFVPAFGEEMNKCRRQVTETAELLASMGYATLELDLFGTGDSAGEFQEATWATWRDNVVSAMSWSAEQGLAVDAVIAARLGCLLAAEALEHARHKVLRTVLWQPVESGHQFMTQFLRLRVAASMMQSDRKETVDELRGQLEQGKPIDVAGYRLSSELWRAIDQRELAPLLDHRLGQLAIYEVGRVPGAELSVPVKRLLRIAVEGGIDTSADRVPGEPFWSSTEIVTNPDLARRTAHFLTADVP